jgi:hypothetical protein
MYAVDIAINNMITSDAAKESGKVYEWPMPRAR